MALSFWESPWHQALGVVCPASFFSKSSFISFPFPLVIFFGFSDLDRERNAVLRLREVFESLKTFFAFPFFPFLAGFVLVPFF